MLVANWRYQIRYLLNVLLEIKKKTKHNLIYESEITQSSFEFDNETNWTVIQEILVDIYDKNDEEHIRRISFG